MKRTVMTCLVLGLALLCAPRNIDAQQKQNPLRKLMDDKLEAAKKLLEGIALENYSQISRSAEKLIQISKTAEWLVHKTPRYELHSNEFRRAADNLTTKAKAKNIDGVALAYMELTMSCVRCHQYVRELRDVNLSPSPR